MAAKTVVLRPRAGAAAGFPGFFAWLAATHPDLYDIARTTLPNAVSQLDDTGSSGALLGAYMDAAQVLSGIYGGNRSLAGYYGGTRSLAGMGADDSVIQDVSPPPDLSNLFASSGLPASIGVTDSTPMPTTTMSDTIANTVKALAAGVLPLISQQKILNVQLTRAQQGLPPLDTSKIADSAGLNVGLTSSTQKTFLMIAGIGGAALLAHALLKGRRRA